MFLSESDHFIFPVFHVSGIPCFRLLHILWMVCIRIILVRQLQPAKVSQDDPSANPSSIVSHVSHLSSPFETTSASGNGFQSRALTPLISFG